MDAPRPSLWVELEQEPPDVADWPLREHTNRRWADASREAAADESEDDIESAPPVAG